MPPNLFVPDRVDDRHDGIQGVTVLGVELVAEHFELLHRLFADINRRTAPHGVVDVAAVDERRIASALIGDAAKFCRRQASDCAVDRTGSRQELRQNQKVPVEHRQGVDVLFRDDRRGLGSRDFHERRRGIHGRLFNDARDAAA